MSEERQEVFFDLLTKKAIYGLDEAEERELAAFDAADIDAELLSFEMTAAAITLTNIDPSEKMPAHIAARIADSAPGPVAEAPVFSYSGEEERPAGSSWFGWMGWLAAAAACVALGVNIYLTRMEAPPQVAVNTSPSPTPKPSSPAEMREDLLRSTPGLVTANWAPGNIKEMKVSGDVVWSDERQAGYMRLRGLPVNDRNKETYQLWIFDKTQDKATPIDGGTFDVTADGDVIIPIDAKLKADDPALFAITVEKPGGVVVSKREKVAALATVETKST